MQGCDDSDEPTSALDPIGRKEIRDLVKALKKQDKTVFLNSHLLGEVESLCDTVAFINRGVILRQGRMSDILDNTTSLDILLDGVNDGIRNAVRRFDPDAEFSGDNIRMRIGSRADIPAIASAVVENGGRLYKLVPHGESLEDVFIGMMEGGGM